MDSRCSMSDSRPDECEEVPEELPAVVEEVGASAWAVISSFPGLTGEGVESIVSSSTGFVAGHLPVRLDTVLEAK